MGYRVGRKKCPNCGAVVTVGTDEEYGFASDTQFQFECPDCHEVMIFNHNTTRYYNELPHDAVLAEPVEDEEEIDL